MFKIGDHVRCVCEQFNIPPNVSGIIIKGPLNFANKNFYTVAFPAQGNLLMPEGCLAPSNGFHVNRMLIGELVTSNAGNKKVNEGTPGIIASDPKKRFGKVFLDVLFEGHNDLVSVTEESISLQNKE
jgi:hypothetical protein